MADAAILTKQSSLLFENRVHPRSFLPRMEPLYVTEMGSAYVTDSRELLASLPESSVNLVVTSPPYALHFQKAYGNVAKGEYVS